jgi:hypothetical protein
MKSIRKRLVLFGRVAGVLVLACGCVSCALKQRGGSMVEGGAASAQVSSLAAAKVTLVRGVVEAKPGTGGDWAPLQPGDLIEEGAELRTGKGGEVELVLEGNGSVLRVTPGTVMRLDKLALRDPNTSDALNVVVQVAEGQVVGLFKSQGHPSTFQLTSAGGASVYVRPLLGESVPMGMAAVPAVPAMPMGTLTYEQIYSGGMSVNSLVASQGLPPGVQLPAIPEPATISLLAVALALGSVCRRRPPPPRAP